MVWCLVKHRDNFIFTCKRKELDQICVQILDQRTEVRTTDGRSCGWRCPPNF